MARALGGLEITGKPASVSQPGTAQGKLRRWTGAGAGVQGGIQHQVNRLFRTQEEGAADDPHVVDLADVTKGLGLDETDREKIERILTETRVDFAMSPKLRTPRFAHGLKGLSEFLMKTKRISPEVRMQVRKRATVWWRKYGKTTYEGKPMIRHVVTKSQLESPTLLKSGGPYYGPRGGKYADPQHKIPWRESKQGKRKKRGKKLSWEESMRSDTEAIRNLTMAQEDMLIDYIVATDMEYMGAFNVVESYHNESGKPGWVKRALTAVQSIGGAKEAAKRRETVEAAYERYRSNPHAEGFEYNWRENWGVILSPKGDQYFGVGSKQRRKQALSKAGGPYIGPRGGLYADPEHKTPWKESHARQHVERARESEKRNRRKGEEEAYERAIQNHNETHVRAMAEEVESVPALQRQRAAVEKMMRRRVKEGSYDFHTARKQGWQDLANAAAQAWAKRGAKISMASRAAYAHELALEFHAKHAKGMKKSLSKATPSNPETGKVGGKKLDPKLMGTGKTKGQGQPGGGPYIGPRGGKYADPQRTIPWKSKKYKFTVEGKDAEKTGQAMEAGIEKAADICQVKPPICHGNLGIPRSEMPQLPDSVIPKFLKQYQDRGIKVTKQTKRVGELKATQREINADKAQGMLNAYKEGSYDPSKKPIIVSKDGYVLDGHHRWAAMLLGDPSNTMRTYQVDVDIKTLLKDANGFEGVSQADFSAPSDMREASNAGDDEDHADVAEGQGKDKPDYEKDVKKALRMEALAAATRDSYLRSRHG